MKKVLSVVLALAMCMSMATLFASAANTAEDPAVWGVYLFEGHGTYDNDPDNEEATGKWSAPKSAQKLAVNDDGKYELNKDDEFMVRLCVTNAQDWTALAAHGIFNNDYFTLEPWSNDDSYFFNEFTEDEYAGDMAESVYKGTFGKQFSTWVLNQNNNNDGHFSFAIANDEAKSTAATAKEAASTIGWYKFIVKTDEAVDATITVSNSYDGSAYDSWQAGMVDVDLTFALNGGAGEEEHVCDYTIAGEVTKAPTAKETGIQIYECECGLTTEVDLPVIKAEDYIAADTAVSATAPENDTVSVKATAAIAAPDFDAVGFLLEGDAAGVTYRYYCEKAYASEAGLTINLKITDVPNIDKVLKVTVFTVLDGVETFGEPYSFNISDAFAG